jgi:hypothetical protein
MNKEKEFVLREVKKYGELLRFASDSIKDDGYVQIYIIIL